MTYNNFAAVVDVVDAAVVVAAVDVVLVVAARVVAAYFASFADLSFDPFRHTCYCQRHYSMIHYCSRVVVEAYFVTVEALTDWH